MWLVGGGLPHRGGADLSQGGMCRRRRAGAERVGVGPQLEAQGSGRPLPQSLHLSSDLALRREQARKEGRSSSFQKGGLGVLGEPGNQVGGG